jgi:uncharacterized protein YggE
MNFKPALAAVAVLLTTSAPALAQEARTAFEATTLQLSATGEAHAAPDIASINLGVQVDAPTAAEALRQNGVQMTATIAALKNLGVAAKDIQTAGLNLNAQYVFHEGEPRKLTGYQASNTVTIVVRDLARLGATVDAVVAAGANQVNGVSFSLSDPQHAEDEARREAVKSLQAKAALYAEATGYNIARLVSLTDGTNDGGAVRPLIMSMRKVAPTPTEPGELDVTANVSAVYELRK